MRSCKQSFAELPEIRLQHVTKIHFLHCIWIFSPENCGAVSDEHGKHFQQDFSSMEKRYKEKWNCAMLTDHCWTLAMDAHAMEYKRQAKRKKIT